MQNSAFWTRITSLYGSQTTPVVLWMQNNVISTRITSLYGFQPSSVVLRIQKNDFKTRIAYLHESQTSPVLFACKIATFGPELLVSFGPNPHLWFSDTKQRLLDPNNKPLWVPDITCRFVHAIHRDYPQNY